VARTYVTDIQDLLGEDGEPPAGRGGDMARYLGRIIEAGSIIPVGKGRLIPVRCANPARRKRCGGQLGIVAPRSGTLDWKCVSCQERGVISNWAATRFDLSKMHLPDLGGDRADLVAPLLELDAVLRRCELTLLLRRLLAEATNAGGEYLFVFAGYDQLLALGEASRKAADGASGEDRRLLDRFAGRVDGLATTLSEFLEPEESPSELLN
jgi:hypothetical protein